MHRNKTGPPRGAGILNVLQATEMVDSSSKLPAEILVTILDYLPVADQLHAARASRRLQEMVYNDTRWVSRLKSMGCWDEREARRRFDEAVRRRREAGKAKEGVAKGLGTATLLDAVMEEQGRGRATSDLRDGFEIMSLGGAPKKSHLYSADTYLDIFKSVKSIRGGARQIYGRIYGALAPFYWDIVRATSHTEPIVFRAFRDPEKQARMLANLRQFCRSDWSVGCLEREQKLISMTSIFEAAAVREFEQSYELWDIDGRMKRYANVLHTLNGARSGIEIFLHKHPIFHDPEIAQDATECLSQAPADSVSLEPSRHFYEVLLAKVNEQAGVIERIFPDPATVFWDFVDKIRENIIMEYVTPLFDECHERSISAYLSAVSGLFEQTGRFFQSLTPPRMLAEAAVEKAQLLLLRVFEPHFDLYLQEELEFFTKQAELQVSQWEKKQSEHDSSLESFYMSNINRSADKKDFLSSFKKVVMMPVTSLPSFPMGSPFATTKPEMASSQAQAPMGSRPEKPVLSGRASPLPLKAPTDELAAKAAIMASKLEGIKSLCSIEVALNLINMAKVSLGRAAVLIPLGGQVGGEAREQCASIFIALLRVLGQRHVKSGFDTAVAHLSHYNPRDISNHDQKGVAPLVTFIELVNVGDLISQMIDVFYEQQLAAPKTANKNDFLDPAGLAKKKFEQMLDGSVAAGLNKGIDVLMDEVDYLHCTTQSPTDYNVASSSATAVVAPVIARDRKVGYGLDIGPTQTAQRIVELVSQHTRMLVGTTDKAMLDVFNGEVGLRLFTAICKHLKRQRISTDGAVRLIADMNLYAEYACSLRNQDLLAYFVALRELSQIYLVDAAHARDLAAVIADADRFGGIFRAEEVYEYAQRRADWHQVRKSVEKAMYGMDCSVM